MIQGSGTVSTFMGCKGYDYFFGMFLIIILDRIKTPRAMLNSAFLSIEIKNSLTGKHR
jgi:hypothetical protein